MLYNDKKYISLIRLLSHTFNIKYSCIFSIKYYNVNNNNKKISI
jgi:hypothetical protein